MFTRVHQLTGKHTLRDGQCYSKANGTLFCFTCFLLSKEYMDQFFTGFSDWKHAEIASNTPKKIPFLGEPIIGNLSLVHCAHYVDLLGDLMYSSWVPKSKMGVKRRP